LTLVPVLLRDT